MVKEFDNKLADSQATEVKPVRPEDFDFDKYEAYVKELNKTCAQFWQQKSGVVVYRRMRVAECFSFGCMSFLPLQV